MCGIAGFWLGANTAISNLNDIARRMCNELSHRGPNQQGVWSSNNERVALGHQRLTVLDLTPTGSQPMASFDSRYRITFNGEIYNHEHLRAEIQNDGVQLSWRGSSDTETLLAALVVWGIDKTLSKLNGMFAFALWDQELKILTLARDRIGEKPLYYGWQGDTLIFGSELKALKAHPVFCSEIDRNALALFLKYSYVPCPSSIYKNIFNQRSHK
jgi:asparagine synthase (glutamine-hydrolysing)